MSKDPVNTFRALRPYLDDIDRDLARAVRNLAEVQPGFGETTPMNGSVGGGSVGSTTSIVERLALGSPIGSDRAAATLDRVRALTKSLADDVVELRRLVSFWSYSTAGEDGAHRGGSGRDANPHAKVGCRSCGREALLVHNDRIYRDGLCRWCYDFQSLEGCLPPTDLLRLHIDGVRITKELMDEHMEPVRARQEAKRAAAAAKEAQRAEVDPRLVDVRKRRDRRSASARQ